MPVLPSSRPPKHCPARIPQQAQSPVGSGITTLSLRGERGRHVHRRAMPSASAPRCRPLFFVAAEKSCKGVVQVIASPKLTTSSRRGATA